MKALAALWLAGLAAAAALPAPAAPGEAAARREIDSVLDRLHAAAAAADTGTYFALFAPDAVFIGTDVGERWSIAQFRAYAEPLFARGRGWVYHMRERHVTLAKIDCGCIAWFDEVLDSESYGTSRGTGTLIKTPSGWRIEQYALTFPMPNALAGDLTKRIREYEKR